jgi:hypothetical protein
VNPGGGEFSIPTPGEIWLTLDTVGHGDLTSASGSPPAVGDPAAYVTADGTQHVIYRDGRDHLHELWWR